MKEKDQICTAARRVVLHAFGTALEVVMQCHGDSAWNTWVMGTTGTQSFYNRVMEFFHTLGFLFLSPSLTPAFKRRLSAHLWTHLPHIIEAVFVEDGVNLGILKSTEQQRLAVVLGPVIEIQHSHAGKVYPVGIQRQPVNVLHQVLRREMETHRYSLTSRHPGCKSLNCSEKAGRDGRDSAEYKTVVISQDTTVWNLLTTARVIYLISCHRTESYHLFSDQ